MRFTGLFIAVTALFTLALLSTANVPPSGLALAAAQSGSGGQSGSDSSGSGSSGSGSDDECRRDSSGSGSSGSGSSGSGDGDGNPIEGRRIFVRENCYSCHGGFAGGLMCPSLREDRPDESDVRDVIEEGTENGMPPFPHLDNERDIENLAAYFGTLRTRCEPTFFHWWEPVPTQ